MGDIPNVGPDAKAGDGSVLDDAAVKAAQKDAEAAAKNAAKAQEEQQKAYEEAEEAARLAEEDKGKSVNTPYQTKASQKAAKK